MSGIYFAALELRSIGSFGWGCTPNKRMTVKCFQEYVPHLTSAAFCPFLCIDFVSGIIGVLHTRHFHLSLLQRGTDVPPQAQAAHQFKRAVKHMQAGKVFHRLNPFFSSFISQAEH